jgi:hypothetical protein
MLADTLYFDSFSMHRKTCLPKFFRHRLHDNRPWPFSNFMALHADKEQLLML